MTSFKFSVEILSYATRFGNSSWKFVQVALGLLWALFEVSMEMRRRVESHGLEGVSRVCSTFFRVEENRNNIVWGAANDVFWCADLVEREKIFHIS